MFKIMRAPSRYVQGENAILELKNHVETLGKSFLVVADSFVMNIIKPTVEECFKNTEKNIFFEIFNGQSTKKEIERLQKVIRNNKCDAIIGIGGGKTFDTVKAVGYFENISVSIVPTIAATDSPCTALSVIYNEYGEFSEYLFYPQNPDLVLVDTTIVSKAPVRFFIAGMGDALATFFEARTCLKSKSPNLVSGEVSQAGYSLSKLCYEILIEYGLKAKLAVENSVSVPAVEKVLEATTYLSGVGAENGGLAAAHSIYNGFTVLEECEKYMHGEIVAFGTLVQLILEDSPMEEIEEVINFCLDVNLPITLKQIGIKEINKDDIMKVAVAACAEGETIHNTLGDVNVDLVFNAILTANSLGEQYIRF